MIATRFYYDGNGIVPVLEDLAYVESLSAEVLAPPIPEAMTFDDILAIDYLDIDAFYRYIQIEETLINSGSVYYPNYVLESDAHRNTNYGNYYELMIEGTDLGTEIGGDSGSEVILEGYLFGFNKGFDFHWVIAYGDHTLPTA